MVTYFNVRTCIHLSSKGKERKQRKKGVEKKERESTAGDAAHTFTDKQQIHSLIVIGQEEAHTHQQNPQH